MDGEEGGPGPVTVGKRSEPRGGEKKKNANNLSEEGLP